MSEPLRVTVVGAGIVGLACAMRLAEAGYEVTVHARDFGADTTSSVAAAIWFPYRAYPESRVIAWGARGYQVLAEMAGVEGSGVRLRSGRQLFRVETPDPWWMPAVPTVDRLAAAELPEGYVDGLRLRVPVVDMSWHLPWLSRRVSSLGVRAVAGSVGEPAELAAESDVVVNCTGFGAREFVGDTTMVPVRGQVVVVEQWGVDEWLIEENEEDTPVYVVPREETVVLGGTAHEGATGLEPDPGIARSIVERCAKLVPEVASARIVRHAVGLRPARHEVRMEADRAADGLAVVHCYGHGGAGVTLAYGCAEEVVSIVGTALSEVNATPGPGINLR
ncbi:MAG: FAD-dependent oxidoreductase [Sciscionella sp.]